MNRRISGLALLLCLLTINAKAMQKHEPNVVFFQADQFEYRAQDGKNNLKWDAQGWIGGDYEKVWLKTEGQKLINGKIDDAEVQLLYSRLLTDFFDVQAGFRYDPQPDPRRGYAVLGLHGLAPYFIEIDTALFLSNEGELTARMVAEYEMLLTQRLILKPAVKLNLAAQEITERGIRAGFNEIELGFRLRYEIRREFAPYIGINWQRKLGQTADLTRRNGEDTDIPAFVAGIGFWF